MKTAEQIERIVTTILLGKTGLVKSTFNPPERNTVVSRAFRDGTDRLKASDIKPVEEFKTHFSDMTREKFWDHYNSDLIQSIAYLKGKS